MDRFDGRTWYAINFGDKEKFWKNICRSIDQVVDEPGFSEDVLESLKTDPNGPQLDLKKIVVDHLNSSVYYAFKGEHEAFGWAIKPGQGKAIGDLVDKLMKNFPGATEDDNGVWSWPIDDKVHPKSGFLVVKPLFIYFATDLELLKEVTK